jgi:hypothetical protein
MWGVILIILIFGVAPAWAEETSDTPGETYAQGETVDCFYQQHVAHPDCQQASEESASQKRNRRSATFGALSRAGGKGMETQGTATGTHPVMPAMSQGNTLTSSGLYGLGEALITDPTAK